MADCSVPNTPNEAYLAHESGGDRSRGNVNLKAGRKYQSGSVLMAETIEGAATGFHVLADATATRAVVLCRYTDATDAAVNGTAVHDTDCVVKANELTVAAGATVAQVTPALLANGIKVRAAA